MGLLDTINSDLNKAIKERDEMTVSSLRLLLAHLHNVEIAKGKKNLADDEVREEIYKMVKKYKESIDAYQKAQRVDLVKKEKAQLAAIEKYLPQALTDLEIENMVDQAISATGTSSIRDMGRLMQTVMSSARGRADGAKVAQIVRKKLSPELTSNA